MGALLCSQCGGPIVIRPGDHVVLGSQAITTGESEQGVPFIEAGPLEGVWCASCLRGWDERLGLDDRSG